MRFVWLVIAFGTLAGASAWAADKDKDNQFQYQTVTTREGLTFRAPEDMPIEMRGGIQAPIPFDEYMYGKFKALESRLVGMETKLARIEEALTRAADQKEKSTVLATS